MGKTIKRACICNCLTKKYEIINVLKTHSWRCHEAGLLVKILCQLQSNLRPLIETLHSSAKLYFTILLFPRFHQFQMSTCFIDMKLLHSSCLWIFSFLIHLSLCNQISSRSQFTVKYRQRYNQRTVCFLVLLFKACQDWVKYNSVSTYQALSTMLACQQFTYPCYTVGRIKIYFENNKKMFKKQRTIWYYY